MRTILAVEDEPDIVLALRFIFERAGFRFMSCADGRSGLRKVHEERPDLVLLDVELPGLDGWTVLERIRDVADLPVLMLSVRGCEADRVRGLRAGADDYVAKPFSNNELLARAEALLRRTSWERSLGDEWEDFHDDGLVRIDRRSRRVNILTPEGERATCLTNLEFRLLNVFARNSGVVLCAAQLLSQVWDDPTGIAPERIKFAVFRLRRKLGWDNEQSPIQAVRGVGYRYLPGE